MKLVLVFLIINIIIFTTALNSERFKLVTSEGNNFLFRSGSPLNQDKKFAYHEIRSLIQKESNLSVSKHITFIDISLLHVNSSDDLNIINVEENFFSVYPDKGFFFLFPIFGVQLTPEKWNQNLAETFNIWGEDKLNYLLNMINLLLKTKTSQSTVILVHCLEGVDRTGEVIGSYLMQYQKKTFAQVLDRDKKIKNGKLPKRKNLNALIWYCLYLNFKYNKSNHCFIS
jgi:hypothetical protein